MPTRTTRSGTTRKSSIELDPVDLGLPGSESGERSAGGERSEPGGRATRGAGGRLRGAAGGGAPAGGGRARARARAPRGPGGRLRAAAAGGRRAELSPELVDDAVNRARVRTAIGELPGGGRISDAVIHGLLAGASPEEEIVGPGGLLAQLTKRLVERALEVELTDHLGYEPHAEPPGGTGNTRNGATPKTRVTDNGPGPDR